MIYIIIVILLLLLAFDAFGETILNGTPFFTAFKVLWSDRFYKLFFNRVLRNYNKTIEKKGEFYIFQKIIYDYLEYNEYISFNIYKKNKVIEIEYSITDNRFTTNTINLKDLKNKDYYYGRWMKGYNDALKHAKHFDGDYIEQIDKIIEAYPQTTHRREQMIDSALYEIKKI